MVDKDEICSKRDITKLLRNTISDETLWQKAYNFCLILTKFVHAPISLKDYKRMEKYTDDEELVIAVFNAIKDYYYTSDHIHDFDIIGHSYCVALLTQSKFNREQTLNYLNKFADILINDDIKGYGQAMYRNMNRLSKEYPDLKELENKLKCFKDYNYWKEKNNK